MAYTTFKMIIFNQFRHALTRHDPKTYLIWCEALSVTLGFDVPPPSPEERSTLHFDWDFRMYFLHGSIPSWVHSETYYLMMTPQNMSLIWLEFDRHRYEDMHFYDPFFQRSREICWWSKIWDDIKYVIIWPIIPSKWSYLINFAMRSRAMILKPI